MSNNIHGTGGILRSQGLVDYVRLFNVDHILIKEPTKWLRLLSVPLERLENVVIFGLHLLVVIIQFWPVYIQCVFWHL